MHSIWKQLLVPFLSVLFFFICFFVFTKFFGPIPFFINSITTTKSDLFTVNGVGKATVIPDTAVITLGVTKTANSVSDAQNQANGIANQITTDVKNLGIADKNIKTTNYNVYPNYDPTNNRTITGYTVSHDLEIRVKPIDKANQAIDVATKDGANVTNSATFTVDDETMQKLEDQARVDAVTKAKQKAESLAKAGGINLGRIVDIQENSNQPGPIAFNSLQSKGVQPDTQPTQLNPGENNIEVTVTLSYQTY